MFRQALFILFVGIGSSLSAQQIMVNGKFVSDSVRLGESIEFTLSARYPSELTVLFPDSTFSFKPFEFQKKKYTVTKTRAGISYDSVIYTLQTYEVDSAQWLSLPVFVRNPQDCTVYFSQIDTVFLRHLVSAIPDSLAATNLPLKTNTNYVKVKWQFNTILFSIIGAVLVVAIILVWIFFGKKIKRYFVLKRLAKKHQVFVTQFNHQLEKALHQPEVAESTLVLWKNYLEELLHVPYSKFTSKEIHEREQNEMLKSSLAQIDRMIYASRAGDDSNSFKSLIEFSEQKYLHRLEEIKNG